MEWVILFALLSMYFDLSSKLKKITNNQNIVNKKDFSILKNMVGKNIKIETDNEYNLVFGTKNEGVLKKYDSTWIVLETKSKKDKSLLYFRIKDVKSIVEVK